MLQQTQVPRVIPKLAQFLERFPTAPACARAPLADVLRLWQGLGYPRRAKALHAAAQSIIAGDGVPTTLADLLALPGVGAYTARAVLAFAYEADVGVVETNIARLLARVVGQPMSPAEVQAVADSLVPAGDAWTWNQVLMDLGAAVCRPAPRCTECPLGRWCAWRGEGEDPSIGSAGVSVRQAPFAGSDRQARGRLMAALATGPLAATAAARVMGRDAATAQRLVDSLVADGLCERHGTVLTLPA